MLLTIIIVVALTTFFILNNKGNNKILLKETKSLTTMQNEYEKDFSTKGYTINKPNVILDPYKSSPLTALIMFETDNKVRPKITVVGKDKNTTT